MKLNKIKASYNPKNKVSLLNVLLILSSGCFAQRGYPPVINDAQQHIYKTINNTDLNLWMFTPPNHKPENKTPAIVFFFGGGWKEGSPEQFVKHCEYLAARGMVAIVADYRVKSRHGVLANDCVTDAKSAIRWVRRNATSLGIDSNRIAAGGASAGGYLAASCATLSKFDAENEDLSISSKPDALVLFNPVLVIGPAKEHSQDGTTAQLESIKKKMGALPAAISPYHNLAASTPQTIIFHGTADKTVPFETITLFTEKMHELSNICTLVAYKGEEHGFFNYGKKSNALYIDTVHKMDAFLVSLGYLKAVPNSTTTTN